jgi:[ribosomal protein S5]-alanine N-acetyltransferase
MHRAEAVMSPSGQEPHFLLSERVGFRRWRPDDLPLALSLWGDLRVTRLIHSGAAWTEERVRQRLLTEIARAEAHDIQYWPIFLLATGDFLGCCGLRPATPEVPVHEFGYHLCAAHWGRGYATEAGAAVVRHAFTALDLPALGAGHHPENDASRRVLLKLGFRHTGDRHFPPTGLMHPWYELTRVAWTGPSR